ncbi:MAG TPA: DUF2007 domain-containing protein [Leptolyngbyaceae cyanobacterium M33_DOE_097]|uniref:DUF2007 domain-containing protein n=1 Tax=Oscillatoriales cyanobacterium SpSt-418 TaxID=2282169 RepID=A0A7C3KF17_9CYAN|nr:DUF2007 domain-containing protein [Leptolyngbyaceae cyanobacterium M33_DOE_097]
MTWITLKTVSFRWEAEMLQQLLEAHQIPTRLVDLGVAPYFGMASPTALQVRLEDQQIALDLLSPIGREEEEDS